MKRSAHFIALASGVALIIVASGSRLSLRGASANGELIAARERMAAALDVVSTRVRVLELMRNERNGGGITGDDGLERVVERRATIAAKLDSLALNAGPDWRGPMAGLRASLAELEYRVDLVELAATDSAAALDVLLRGWLADTDRQLVRIDNAVQDSFAAAAYRVEIRMIRSGRTALEMQLAGLGPSRTSSASPTQASVGRELALLRRRLRALVRSTDALDPHDS